MASLYKSWDRGLRNIKKGVNRSVLKVPDVEQKTLDATSNEPWGPHGQLLAELARRSFHAGEYGLMMDILWKRLQDTGKNWRHVYKTLIVMEYTVSHGTERIIADLNERASYIQGLRDFQYIDPEGQDQGKNVRAKANALLDLIKDKPRIEELRQRAAHAASKIQGYSSGPLGSHRGGMSASSSYGDVDTHNSAPHSRAEEADPYRGYYGDDGGMRKSYGDESYGKAYGGETKKGYEEDRYRYSAREEEAEAEREEQRQGGRGYEESEEEQWRSRGSGRGPEGDGQSGYATQGYGHRAQEERGSGHPGAQQPSSHYDPSHGAPSSASSSSRAPREEQQQQGSSTSSLSQEQPYHYAYTAPPYSESPHVHHAPAAPTLSSAPNEDEFDPRGRSSVRPSTGSVAPAMQGPPAASASGPGYAAGLPPISFHSTHAPPAAPAPPTYQPDPAQAQQQQQHPPPQYAHPAATAAVPYQAEAPPAYQHQQQYQQQQQRQQQQQQQQAGHAGFGPSSPFEDAPFQAQASTQGPPPPSSFAPYSAPAPAPTPAQATYNGYGSSSGAPAPAEYSSPSSFQASFPAVPPPGASVSPSFAAFPPQQQPQQQQHELPPQDKPYSFSASADPFLPPPALSTSPPKPVAKGDLLALPAPGSTSSSLDAKARDSQVFADVLGSGLIDLNISKPVDDKLGLVGVLPKSKLKSARERSEESKAPSLSAQFQSSLKGTGTSMSGPSLGQGKAQGAQGAQGQASTGMMGQPMGSQGVPASSSMKPPSAYSSSGYYGPGSLTPAFSAAAAPSPGYSFGAASTTPSYAPPPYAPPPGAPQGYHGQGGSASPYQHGYY